MNHKLVNNDTPKCECGETMTLVAEVITTPADLNCVWEANYCCDKCGNRVVLSREDLKTNDTIVVHTPAGKVVMSKDNALTLCVEYLKDGSAVLEVKDIRTWDQVSFKKQYEVKI